MTERHEPPRCPDGSVCRLPILTYHSLDESGSVISTSPALFRWQMEQLWTRGWKTATLDQLLDGYRQWYWPQHTFLLTFDDGFANFSEHALPLLERLGYSAMLFVVADWVGRTNNWPRQWRDFPCHTLMNWEELTLAAARGMQIGAHSLSHQPLVSLDPIAKKREILQSRRVIEDHIEQAVRAFAYPYGESDPALEEVVTGGFDAGFGTRLGFATRSSRAAAFERIDMFYLRRPEFFQALQDGWLEPYLRVRQWLRDWRHAAGMLK